MKFRVGEYGSLVVNMGYVIQKKVWWGWKNIHHYLYADSARVRAKQLEKEGHEVLWFIPSNFDI